MGDGIILFGGTLYLDELEELEQEAFLALAQNIVSVDGDVSPEEQRMLSDASREMRREATQFEAASPGNALFEHCLSVISRAESRAIVMLELASFAFVDGVYREEEREFLRSLARSWGIDPLTVVRIEEWGETHVSLAADAVSILDEVAESMNRVGDGAG